MHQKINVCSRIKKNNYVSVRENNVLRRTYGPKFKNGEWSLELGWLSQIERSDEHSLPKFIGFSNLKRMYW